jgi:hypothetical protein
MDHFDRDYRDKGDWLGWEVNKNHKFAIEHEARLYLVKMVVSLATGVPRDKFSGGMESGQAGRYAEDAGLDVIRLPGRGDDLGEVPRQPRYWAVGADPNRYRVLDAVRDLEFTTWITDRRPLRLATAWWFGSFAAEPGGAGLWRSPG